MDSRKIFVERPFNEQYTLTIEVDAMLVNAVMRSKTEIRYDFTVISVDDDSFVCRLVQLDIFVHESNNPLLREVADVTAAFNRMFTELQLKMNHKGELIEVLNMDLIRSKWQQSKDLMQTAMQNNRELAELISLNDALFIDPEKIKMAIRANEFIQVYFGDIFGAKIPVSFFKDSVNVFNTAILPWLVNVKYGELQEAPVINALSIEVSAVPRVKLGTDYVKHAYKSFEEQLDIRKISPTLSIESKYLLEPFSGRLIECNIYKEEIADKQRLYFRTQYKMKADSDKQSTHKNSEVETKKEDEKITKSRLRFFD